MNRREREVDKETADRREDLHRRRYKASLRHCDFAHSGRGKSNCFQSQLEEHTVPLPYSVDGGARARARERERERERESPRSTMGPSDVRSASFLPFSVGFESQAEQIEWSHAAPGARTRGQASEGIMGARLKNEPMAATLVGSPLSPPLSVFSNLTNCLSRSQTSL